MEIQAFYRGRQASQGRGRPELYVSKAVMSRSDGDESESETSQWFWNHAHTGSRVRRICAGHGEQFSGRSGPGSESDGPGTVSCRRRQHGGGGDHESRAGIRAFLGGCGRSARADLSTTVRGGQRAPAAGLDGTRAVFHRAGTFDDAAVARRAGRAAGIGQAGIAAGNGQPAVGRGAGDLFPKTAAAPGADRTGGLRPGRPAESGIGKHGCRGSRPSPAGSGR